MILKGREQKTIRSNCPGTPKASATGRVVPKAAGASPGAVGAHFLEEEARFARSS